MTYSKLLFAIAVACLLLLAHSAPEAASASSTNISLDFNSLPSAQGWIYENDGTGLPETDVFSVNGTLLYQDTVNTSAGEFNAWYYRLPNVVDPNLPFVLEVRARIIQEEHSDPNNTCGFCFLIDTGTELFGIGLGINQITDAFNNTMSSTVNTTLFHTYRLEATPGVGYQFYVDNVWVASGPPRAIVGVNSLVFGDITRGPNAIGEITQLSFQQQNDPPVVNANGPYLVAVGQTIPLDGTASDPEGDPLTYSWSATEGTFDNNSLEDPNYTAGNNAGVFDLTLTVDDGTNTVSSSTMVVVYDPDGGFVTGGGWIYSTAGDCKAAFLCDTAASGKANFGFVSKYHKGANIPTGNTEFNFKAAGLHFQSQQYDWLVVNQGGTNAQYKGTGTINGLFAPNGEPFKFMIWANDNDPSGNDTFRIKIWYEDNTEIPVYENGSDQDIGGGNIKIHKK